MPELAIKGGEPVAPGGLRLEWPIIDEADKFAVLEALTSRRWCAVEHGPETKNGQFEAAFCRYLGVEYGILVDNGTNALFLALKAGGIEPGDEVIVPAVTFIATAAAVIHANAIPIFADINPETYQIDPNSVRRLISDRTKAVIPVHYGGYPADMDEIMQIAGEHNLLVIEDAAEAHGSEWRGRKVGSIGHFGCFSFQQGKPLTCGEGGFVATGSRELAAKAASYANFGRITGKADIYEHHWLGYNMRLSEIHAALLLSQLRKLPMQTEIRHANGEYLASQLEKIGGVKPLKRDPRITKRGYYFFFIRYISEEFGGVHRDIFLKALRAEGIPAHTAHNRPLYMNPAFEEMKFGRTGCPIKCSFYGKPIDYSKVHCPVAEYIYKNEVVALPKDILMDRKNVNLVIEAVKKIKENIHELAD